MDFCSFQLLGMDVHDHFQSERQKLLSFIGDQQVNITVDVFAAAYVVRRLYTLFFPLKFNIDT